MSYYLQLLPETNLIIQYQYQYLLPWRSISCNSKVSYDMELDMETYFDG